MRSVRRRRIGRPSCWPATWPRKRASRCPSRQCEPRSMLWAMCVSVPPGPSSARLKRKPITWETRGSVEVLLAGASAPEPLPVEPLVEADLQAQLPADLAALLALLPQADLYRARMRCSSPFTRRSHGSGASRGGAGNAWSRPLETTGKSMGLACSTGAMAGSMAESLLDAPPMCSVNKCGQPLPAPNVAGGSLL
jgi:hypothetical protein